MPDRADEPLFDCRCNWCGRDFTESQMVTNTCPDCRRRAHGAYNATLAAIRAERLHRGSDDA